MHKVAPTLPRSRSVEIPPEVPQIVEPTGNKLVNEHTNTNLIKGSLVPHILFSSVI